jgi:hypothetical protein
VSAGDVLLFARPITWANFRRDKFGTLMCALIHLTTRSKWNHAALAIGPDENGVELMVEATNRGVVVSPIASADEIQVVGFVPDLPVPLCGKPNHLNAYHGNDLEEVLAWGTGRVGNRYGYVTAFFCGLRNLFPGWSVVQDRAFICSQLVSEALERAGHDFDKSTEKVSPGDLAEHFGVNRR